MSRQVRELNKLMQFLEEAHNTLARISNVVQRVTVEDHHVTTVDVFREALEEYKNQKEREIKSRWGNPDEH